MVKKDFLNEIQSPEKATDMKHLAISAILTLACLLCHSQDSIHVTRRYENDSPVTKWDSAFNSIPNILFISLDEGFDDSVTVTVNSELVFSGYLKTNESIGLAKTLIIPNINGSEKKLLKVTFVNASRCIIENVNTNYKSLQIRGLNTWLLVYTNRFPMRM
jgi:hypothetical protein